MQFLSFLFLIMILITSSHGQDLKKQESKLANLGFDQICLKLLDNSLTWNAEVKRELSEKWEVGSVPIVLEMARFSRVTAVEGLFRMLGEKTKLSFGSEREWENWIWEQDYTPFASYPELKSKLHSKIDPRFGEYFRNESKSTIRLDEVVWGGVRKDGIPPLRNPKMISVEKAKYLGDNDIVFGIEVNGEARAYPKRILAWHEMFTDTIQGTPLAGVY